MIMNITVSADVASTARAAAVGQARAQGWRGGRSSASGRLALGCTTSSWT